MYSVSTSPPDGSFIDDKDKKEVAVKFVHGWVKTVGKPILDDGSLRKLIEELTKSFKGPNPLGALMTEVNNIITSHDAEKVKIATWTVPPPGGNFQLPVYPAIDGPTQTNWFGLKPKDKIRFRFYHPDHAYFDAEAEVSTSANDLIEILLKAPGGHPSSSGSSSGEYVLVQLKFPGVDGATPKKFDGDDRSVLPSISVHGRLYICLKSEAGSLKWPVEEGELPAPALTGKGKGTGFTIRRKSANELKTTLLDYHTIELAYHLNMRDRAVMERIHVYELLSYFGIDGYGKYSPNLHMYARIYDETQYWTTTEILTASDENKPKIMKKLIHLAYHLCTEHRNMHSAFAIFSAISSAPVTRLTQLIKTMNPEKNFKYQQLMYMLDPAGNYKGYKERVKSFAQENLQFTFGLPPLFAMLERMPANPTFPDADNHEIVNVTKMLLYMDTIQVVFDSKVKIQEEDAEPSKTTKSLKAANDEYNQTYLKNMKYISDPRVLDKLLKQSGLVVEKATTTTTTTSSSSSNSNKTAK